MDTLAKPYGSAWLGGQQALMQDSTVAVQQLYEEGGFEISEDFRELPDHVAAELEFLYLLIFRETEAQRNGDLESTNAMTALRQRFLAEHLGAWIEPFTQAVKAWRANAVLPRAGRTHQVFRWGGGRCIAVLKPCARRAIAARERCPTTWWRQASPPRGGRRSGTP